MQTHLGRYGNTGLSANLAAALMAAPTGSAGSHVVAPDQTLCQIAKLYDVDVRDLIAANAVAIASWQATHCARRGTPKCPDVTPNVTDCVGGAGNNYESCCPRGVITELSFNPNLINRGMSLVIPPKREEPPPPRPEPPVEVREAGVPWLLIAVAVAAAYLLLSSEGSTPG